MAGFVKSFVFALADRAASAACAACRPAPARRRSGDAATRAVVSGIMLIVIVDGVFAVLFFLLDI